MASISPEECAQGLLECSLEGRPWSEGLLGPLLDGPASHLLFRIVAEGLADRFEPRLCDSYAALFCEVIARKVEGLHAHHLYERYQRVRKPRVFEGSARRIENVFVLSRVTLGADIAVTSVLLDAARRRFPGARVVLVGPGKNWGLFREAGIAHMPVSYRRGGALETRFGVFEELRAALAQPASIVIDPDSRLTQLGLLPVCREEDYFFFESRAFGADSRETLSALAREWACRTFGVETCGPFVAVKNEAGAPAEISVSLGVGENAAKRIADPFEASLIRYLASRADVIVDLGGDAGESGRVACAAHGTTARRWNGSFAGFVSQIAQSRLYVGYDSAGAHAAAAAGIPLVSIFAGFASERMFERWKPDAGPLAKIVRVDDPDPARVWERTRAALDSLLRALQFPS